MKKTGKLAMPDPVSMMNLARPAEQTRLLVPLMAAEWRLLYFPAAELVTTDRGFTLTSAERDGDPTGLACPIGPHHALSIRRRERGLVARAAHGKWKAQVKTTLGSAADADSLNRSMARSAERFVVGSSREVVDSLRDELQSRFVPERASLHLMWGIDTELAMTETEWWQLRCELSWPPDDTVRDRCGGVRLNPDWNPPKDEWVPTFFAPSSTPHLSAISKVGGLISLDPGHVRQVRRNVRGLHDLRRELTMEMSVS